MILLRQGKIEALFTREEPSAVVRTLLATVIVIAGLGLDYLLFRHTGYYSLSITIICILLAAFLCGVYIGTLAAIAITLVADYLFIPPVGLVLTTPAERERFAVNIGLALVFAISSAIVRAAFRSAFLSKREAEEARAEMEDVLAFISHDIRNPITSIKLGLEMVQRTPGKADKDRVLLARLSRSVERMDALVQSLLDVSRLRSGRAIALEFYMTDLGAEVRDVVEDFSILKDRKIDLKGCDSIFGAWSMTAIRRALENLLDNATKYGDPNKPITVEARRRGELAVLSVQNWGPVIPPSEQAMLFEAFRRTRNSEESKIRGWGLGLALVKGIAEGHGGSVRVESSESVGTRFILELPIRSIDQALKKSA